MLSFYFLILAIFSIFANYEKLIQNDYTNDFGFTMKIDHNKIDLNKIEYTNQTGSITMHPFKYNINYYNKSYNFFLEKIPTYYDYNCTLNKFSLSLDDTTKISFQSSYDLDAVYTVNDKNENIIYYSLIDKINLNLNNIINITSIKIDNINNSNFTTIKNIIEIICYNKNKLKKPSQTIFRV
jgi:hypothetical protein